MRSRDEDREAGGDHGSETPLLEEFLECLQAGLPELSGDDVLGLSRVVPTRGRLHVILLRNRSGRLMTCRLSIRRGRATGLRGIGSIRVVENGLLSRFLRVVPEPIPTRRRAGYTPVQALPEVFRIGRQARGGATGRLVATGAALVVFVFMSFAAARPKPRPKPRPLGPAGSRGR